MTRRENNPCCKTHTVKQTYFFFSPLVIIAIKSCLYWYASTTEIKLMFVRCPRQSTLILNWKVLDKIQKEKDRSQLQHQPFPKYLKKPSSWHCQCSNDQKRKGNRTRWILLQAHSHVFLLLGANEKAWSLEKQNSSMQARRGIIHGPPRPGHS